MMLDAADQRRLLGLARDSMAHGVATGLPIPLRAEDWPASLWVPRATFVTLTRKGRLRGCRGRIDAVQPLPQDVAVSAVQAALDDPRFAPVGVTELPELAISISILTPPEPLPAADYRALRDSVRPHRDGLLLSAGDHRATFLPKVWEQLPEPDAFLVALWEKAGLLPEVWPDDIRIERYGAIDFAEE
ncbi:MAG: AmmeMemoRadiSam system protein A [Gammaproteobacteria bacterium]|nr:AmmeMemoRadiSam system protein A [Gammaproteobacteria bacterium]